jgi:putative transposase
MLQAASRADEIRRDCVDPTLLYLKFGRQWVSASSRESIVLRSRGELDLLFARMMGRTIRSENARKREEISRARFDRIERANASAEAIAHLPTESRPPATTEPHESDAFDGLDDLVPFEIENVKCERK